MTLSIDVSNNQGSVPWDEVKARGVTVVGLKEDEGVWFRDSYFADNFHAVTSRGMVALPYHFARPDRDPGSAGGIAEANHFLSAFEAYRNSPFMGLPVLDYESVRDVLFAVGFAARVYAVLGRFPIIYCSGSRVPEIDASPLLRGLPLWVAAYGSSYAQYVGSHKGPVVMWQYTDAYALPDGQKVDASHVLAAPTSLLLHVTPKVIYEEVWHKGKRIFRVRLGHGRLRKFLRGKRFLAAVTKLGNLTFRRRGK